MTFLNQHCCITICSTGWLLVELYCTREVHVIWPLWLKSTFAYFLNKCIKAFWPYRRWSLIQWVVCPYGKIKRKCHISPVWLMLMLLIQKCHKMGPATLSGINHCVRLPDFDWSEYQSINNVYSYMTPHFNQLQVLCLTDFRSDTDTVLNIPVLLKVNRSMHKSLNACSAVF